MRPGRLLLAGLAFALVLTGCSEPDVVADPPPLATPTAGSASPTSPSLTTTPPASATTTAPTASTSIPAAAQAHTDAGAEAFARYYLAQVNLAWTGPDPSKLDGLASPSCKSCANFAATASSLAADQLRYEGDPLSLGPSVLLPESRPDEVKYDFVFIQEPRRVINSRAQVNRSVGRETALSQFSISWIRGAWQVKTIEVVSVS